MCEARRVDQRQQVRFQLITETAEPRQGDVLWIVTGPSKELDNPIKPIGIIGRQDCGLSLWQNLASIGCGVSWLPISRPVK